MELVRGQFVDLRAQVEADAERTAITQAPQNSSLQALMPPRLVKWPLSRSGMARSASPARTAVPVSSRAAAARRNINSQRFPAGPTLSVCVSITAFSFLPGYKFTIVSGHCIYRGGAGPSRPRRRVTP